MTRTLSLLLAVTAFQPSPALAGGWRGHAAGARECYRLFLSGAESRVPAEHHPYAFRRWAQFAPQPPGAYRIRSEWTDRDEWLWGKSLVNGGVEVAVYEAFDREGRVLETSALVLGAGRNVPTDVTSTAYDSFLRDVIDSPSIFRVHRIRMTHTHPPLFFQWPTRADPVIGFVHPEQLSPGDLGEGARMRFMLNGISQFKHVDLEMAVVLKTRPLGLGRERRRKTSVVYLGEAR